MIRHFSSFPGFHWISLNHSMAVPIGSFFCMCWLFLYTWLLPYSAQYVNLWLASSSVSVKIQPITSSHSLTLKLLPSPFDCSKDCWGRGQGGWPKIKKKVLVLKFSQIFYINLSLMYLRYLFLGCICNRQELSLICYFKINPAFAGFIGVFGKSAIYYIVGIVVSSLFALKLVSLVISLWMWMFLNAILVLSHF